MLKPEEITAGFINERLGLGLPAEDMGRLLQNVGFECKVTGEGISYWAPAWRMDIQDPEDIVEEVGRLYGFDKLPRELPWRTASAVSKNSGFEMRRKIGQILSGAGANEVKTYSFVHERVLKNAGQDPARAFKLGNALSPDLQYYRLSLVPSLLDKVHMNIKAGHDQFALYEFGKAHIVGELDEEGLPREFPRLAFVYAAKKSKGAAYYMARRYVEALSPGLRFVPREGSDSGQHEIFRQLMQPFDPARSAVLMDGEHFVGVVGEFSPATRRAFKLPEAAAGFELFQSHLQKLQPKPYRPLSRFPYVTQDISLRVAPDVVFGDIYATAQKAAADLQVDGLVLELAPLDIYQPADASSKTYTLRLQATSYTHTLTDAVVGEYVAKVVSACQQAHGAEQV